MADSKLSTGAKAGIVVGTAALGLGVAYVLRPGWFAPQAPAAPQTSGAPPSPPAPATTPSSPAAGSAATGGPSTMVSKLHSYPPGSTATTAVHHLGKPGVQRWSVGADGVTLTKAGPWLPMTPELQAETVATTATSKPIRGGGGAGHTGAHRPTAASSATSSGAPSGAAPKASPPGSPLGSLPAGIPTSLPTSPADALGSASKLLPGPAAGMVAGATSFLGGGGGAAPQAPDAPAPADAGSGDGGGVSE